MVGVERILRLKLSTDERVYLIYYLLQAGRTESGNCVLQNSSKCNMQLADLLADRCNQRRIR